MHFIGKYRADYSLLTPEQMWRSGMKTEWRKKLDRQKRRKQRAADPERVIATQLIRQVRAIRNRFGKTKEAEMLDKIFEKHGARFRRLQRTPEV